ncbi:hypothetical protein [Saccharicrinis aurantiacus]|uniref:hypothetical protein n=1 Tax=Saccharicrinis aurantiacus TaxID=1849719 RepID=UPI000950038B|nr:hypothetical protein [Saccharicrinis aurantiacus]
MFPFVIKYKKTLNSNFDLIENEVLLKSFKEKLKRDGVDRIFIENNSSLSYKNNFFAIRPGLNHNIWAGISGGQIEIIKSKEKRKISYLFNTSRFFIVGGIAGIAFGLFSKMILVGLFAFSSLGVLNWIISISRHRVNLSSLLNEVIRNNKNALQKKTKPIGCE